MDDETLQQNADGSWTPAVSMPYPLDPRPFWLKLCEFPFRCLGWIAYDPIIEIPQDAMVWYSKPGGL